MLRQRSVGWQPNLGRKHLIDNVFEDQDRLWGPGSKDFKGVTTERAREREKEIL